MAKKRFGVSMDSRLVEDLDSIAEQLSLSRSEIVERAVVEYIRDHHHYLVNHTCTGVLLVAGEKNTGVEKLLEEYRDIVVQYTHIHLERECLRVIVVRGPSERIALLHRSLEEAGCRARYIPITSHTSFTLSHS